MAYLEPRKLSFFPYDLQKREKPRKICTDKLYLRTNFQWFFSKAPRSSFKKLVISMPLLLRGLRTMSLAKSVPKGLRPQKCECTKLREPPPVPYIPEKDEVQEEVAKNAKPSNQYFSGKGYNPPLYGVVQKWDPRSFSHACNGGTGCPQEIWYFQRL
jgi:hypothetical protein